MAFCHIDMIAGNWAINESYSDFGNPTSAIHQRR